MLKSALIAAALALPACALAAEMSVDTAYERIETVGQQPWRATGASLTLDENNVLKSWGGLLQSAERYGAHANAAEVFGVRQLASGMALEGRLFASEGADFLAKKGVEATLYAGLPAGMELMTTLGRKLYARDASSLLRVRLDRDFGPWRVGAGVARDLEFSEQTTFGSVKYRASTWSLGLHLAKGVEAERLESGATLRTPVRSGALAAEMEVTQNTRFRAIFTRMLTTQSRAGVSLGLVHRF